jgi:hypothetical protein
VSVAGVVPLVANKPPTGGFSFSGLQQAVELQADLQLSAALVPTR